ncbi:receptor-like protein EIX1 [Rosa rugosa]|uniref:receptor-like protein EIX1 n=1 Tax=Rosa rugosa TaxID=74645 RepID=UPI002B415D19|nr:receptor-like protein EIX1 [Rosa rugosa]
MELGRCLKHVYAISIFIAALLHTSASLSLGHHGSNVTKCIAREREALLAIKQDLVDEYNRLSSWGSGGAEVQNQDCCIWEGVYCDDRTGHILQLDLGIDMWRDGEFIDFRPLQGKLSPKLAELHNLTYLDLRNNFISGGKNPWFIGSLTNLRYLDLSGAGLCGLIPYKNLTHLEYLNLAWGCFSDSEENLDWLPQFSSLKYLDLSGYNLSNVFNWSEIVKKLPNLRNLTLRECGLPPPVLSHTNTSNSLVSVGLSYNPTISSSIFIWLSYYTKSLAFLDLSDSQLSGPIPNVFRNVSSLAFLDLSFNELSGQIPDAFGNMSFLAHLALSYNQLEGEIPKSISQLCAPQSLETLDLSYNDLDGPLPNVTNLSSLKQLSLHENHLSGILSESIGKLSSLKELNLAENQLSGIIPESIGKLLSMHFFGLSGNRFSGRIPESIEQLSSLLFLDLSRNQLSGRIPEWIWQLSSLETLDLSSNQLSGTIPQSIGQLSNLSTLNLSVNSLEGVISEIHFSKLSKLYKLDLSDNQLVFKVQSDWVPPFQLYSLNLRSCKVGPSFPKWLRTQKICIDLDISYAGISDVLPSLFWSLFGKFETIDLSHNQFRGTFWNLTLEVPSFSVREVRFSSNQMDGQIPSILSNVSYLDLSNNRFSDIASFFCAPKVKMLKFLNLSSNHVSEELPDCWRHLVNLELLDLSNNAFFGKIPTTIGSLFRMETLKLRSNTFVGELPSSMKNCTSLKVIDLGDNKLSNSVPEWLGVSLPNLVILILQSNQFSGSLPSQLCHLTHVQILDFSMNEISGTIPKCLDSLTSLAQQGNSSPTIQHSLQSFEAGRPSSSPYYEDDATIMWKGRMFPYKKTLGLLKTIDFSSNRLTGEIPSEITRLVGLVSLNLSRNHLTGQIPPDIGMLQWLDFLDLSRNQIDGEIPTSLARIDRLGYLDLSNNNLSGEIPTGTQLQGFDPSVFAGNPQLCGLPLRNLCAPWPDETSRDRQNASSDEENTDELITRGFYISLGLGFVVGFWGVCGSLVFKKSWRYAYYKFLNALNDWLYVRAALIKRQLLS